MYFNFIILNRIKLIQFLILIFISISTNNLFNLHYISYKQK